MKQKFEFTFRTAKHGEMVLFLIIGFLFGNIFGTFVPTIRFFIPWDGFIICFLLGCMELISYGRYHQQNRFFLMVWLPFFSSKRGQDFFFFPFLFTNWMKKKILAFFDKPFFFDSKATTPFEMSPWFFFNLRSTSAWRWINSFKIGILIGFFIDAYKVGS